MDKLIVNNTNNSRINIYRKDNLQNFPKTINISNIKTFEDLFKEIDKNLNYSSSNIILNTNMPNIGYVKLDKTPDNKVNFINSDTFNYVENIVNGDGDGIECLHDFYLDKNLYVKQEITAFSLYTPSDQKFKKNINKLSGSLDIIKKINPVSFQWKDDINIISDNNKNKFDVGFIAQELEEILPILVDNNIINGIDFKTIREAKLIPYLVDSVQILEKRLVKLEKNKI
tara:strand:+ start:6434 stop:7117 length:684 start_codon:yes stop_codon:yes gene_type:complete